eukprot:s3205_g4.t1
MEEWESAIQDVVDAAMNDRAVQGQLVVDPPIGDGATPAEQSAPPTPAAAAQPSEPLQPQELVAAMAPLDFQDLKLHAVGPELQDPEQHVPALMLLPANSQVKQRPLMKVGSVLLMFQLNNFKMQKPMPLLNLPVTAMKL